MADVFDIAKAKAYQKALEKVIGLKPELDIKADYVRVYYPPDRLRQVQGRYKALVESPPGKVRIDIKSVIQPYYVKKLIPLLAGSILAGFLFGRW